jgi:hypothetical protein
MARLIDDLRSPDDGIALLCSEYVELALLDEVKDDISAFLESGADIGRGSSVGGDKGLE